MVELPLGVDVPDGWVPVDPAESGAPGAALVVVLPTPEGEFTPNITVGVGDPESTVDIHAAADAAVERLSGVADELVVRSRQDVGGEPAPGVAQVIDLLVGGQRLAQYQVHLSIPLPDNAGHVAVELAGTCTPSQAERAVPDFQRLVASFHLRADDE
ncbi:hypothetical protein [Kutzneria buriramensis]|uniref:Lipoprotein LpqN n=1 Tax=Kutzneria buriramensis TaxID=1045776 RepID=A0A3E0HYS4_9PSEU|nr:hypothetical protein [Kutzneria buriramensis]REH51627.1 hypothetical protein BCF44_10376 [Kutzneria buriramensis]